MQNQICKYLVNLEKDLFTIRLQESIKFIQQAIYHNPKFLDSEVELSICYAMFFRGLIYQLNKSHSFLNTKDLNISTENICLIPKKSVQIGAKGMSFIIIIKAIDNNLINSEETSQQLQFKAQQGIQEIYQNKFDDILDKNSPDSNKVFISLAFYKDFVDVIIKSKLNLDYDKQTEWENILSQINQPQPQKIFSLIQSPKIIKIQTQKNSSQKFLMEPQELKEEKISFQQQAHDEDNGQFNDQAQQNSQSSTSATFGNDEKSDNLNVKEDNQQSFSKIQKKVVLLKKSQLFKEEKQANNKLKNNSKNSILNFVIKKPESKLQQIQKQVRFIESETLSQKKRIFRNKSKGQKVHSKQKGIQKQQE